MNGCNASQDTEKNDDAVADLKRPHDPAGNILEKI